jgi:protein involved in polysaccharide export with SLBB domain
MQLSLGARVVVFVLLLLVGCNKGQVSQLPVVPPEEDTTFGAGDIFEVRVLGEKDLSAKYQVGPDGKVLFPFIGSLTVAGKEADQIALEIADKLKEGQYLTNPQVSVILEQSNSKRVSILGAVAKPGTLPIVPGMTVVQAVSTAGGFTNLASKDDTVVTRRVNGELQRYRIPVSDIARGQAEDFPLRAGDIVFVPERVF